MEEERIKKFPVYFNNIDLPECAKEQELVVFRACASGKVDRDSFLNSYEENGFRVSAGGEEDDPAEYSLSTYRKFRDVRRFMTMTSKFHVPFKIAKGVTNPECGVCAETREWRPSGGKKSKSSHVDYWLYEGAQPWLDFELYNEEKG